MSLRKALEAASQSTTLRGVTPKITGQGAVVAVHFALLSAGVVVIALTDGYARLNGIAPLVVGIVWMHRWRRSINRSSIALYAASNALSDGRIDESHTRYVSLLKTARSSAHVALALNGLGSIAFLRGHFPDAVCLFRAASRVEQHRSPASGAALRGHSRGALVRALIANVEIDAARAIAGTPDPTEMLSGARAVLASSRALLALRTNDPAGALRILETNRRVMQNVLTGNDAALAEVLEAAALAALAATPEGAPRPTHPVPVDAEARAFVTRLLPECEPLLVDDFG